MNIKSLLLGSAAALAVVSGAQAADAVVAAAPEPAEYVKVCDAFGAGYFYIPGGDTCIKFSGRVRVTLGYNSRAAVNNWDAVVNAQLNVDTAADSELGAVKSHITFDGNASGLTPGSTNSVGLDSAYISVGGLDVGLIYSWWDDGLAASNENLSQHGSADRSMAARYTYTGGNFTVGAAVEELASTTTAGANSVGLDGKLGAKFGGVNAFLLGGYDVDDKGGAVELNISAPVGPGTFAIDGIWASDANNAYYNASQWSIAAAYGIKASDKLTITPYAQYLSHVATGTIPAASFSSNNGYVLGAVVAYDLAKNLTASANVSYLNTDGSPSSWKGYFRLQRSF